MRTFLIGLVLCAGAFSVRGAVFQMDRKGDAIVEVVEAGNEYRVTCRFSPQTKFRNDVNARLNDSKGDSLCKKGIARYLNASPKDVISISGQYSKAPVTSVGGKLCYSYGVPLVGCKIEVAGDAKRQEIAPELPVVTTPVTAQAALHEQVAKAVAPEAVDKEDRSNVAKITLKEKTYVCVTRYRETNGRRTMVSQREYRGTDFKSHEEFERFCQDEFARIRAKGEANLKAVRNLVK